MMKEQVLGWDTEWFDPLGKPKFPHLIQISGLNCVWVIDGIWLQSEPKKEVNGVLGVLTSIKNIFHVFKGKEDINTFKK